VPTDHSVFEVVIDNDMRKGNSELRWFAATLLVRRGLGFFQMLGLAVTPGIGGLIGTWIAEKKYSSNRVSAAASHGIAGTMLGLFSGDTPEGLINTGSFKKQKQSSQVSAGGSQSLGAFAHDGCVNLVLVDQKPGRP
jgi:hypothetical protein|tara:strand:+ start:704 stop:1114 length:411 start_codon:yes stop_codon:yes gene_type:complete